MDQGICRAWLLRAVVLVSLAAACAGKSPALAPPSPSRAWQLTDGDDGPEIAALVEAFYGADFAVPAMQQRLDEALLRHPASSTLHEMAGYLAQLRLDERSAGMHFRLAAADRQTQLAPLYLWEASAYEVTGQDRADNLALLGQIRAAHPDPMARASATRRLASLQRRLGRLEEAQALRGDLQPIEPWQLAAAFDNDQGKGLLTTYPPETKIDLAAAMPGSVVPARWRPVPGLIEGEVPLDDLVWPRTNSLVYLLTYVRSDRDQTAVLRLSTDVPLRLWWNDALLLSEQRLEGGDADSLAVPVRLQRGWNKLLVKSGNRGSRRWGLSARLTDAAGAPLAGLETSREPHATPVDKEGATTDGVWRPAIFDKLPAGRRRFLGARLFTRAGFLRKRLPPLQEMQAANPLVTYHTALALWENEELGKALDLLNEGVSKHPEARAFLVKRARFFGQKGQWDKAEPDLRAVVEAAPQALHPRLDLADLLETRRWGIERCQSLSQTLERWPDSLLVLRDLADCLADEGYGPRAAGLLQRALALEPGNTGVLQSLATQATRLWDFAGALGYVARLRAHDPLDPDLLRQEAELQRRAGQPAAAQAALRRAIELDPDGPLAYELLGDLAAWAGDTGEATRWRKLALERNPKDTALAERIGDLQPARLGALERYVPTKAEIDAAVAGAAKVEVAPGSQVVALLDHEVTRVAADGSAQMVVTLVAQAKNVQGRDSLTQAHLWGRGDAKILHAYAVGAKGERTEASSISGSLVRFRNLEVGSIIVLQYMANQGPRPYLPNHYSRDWYFQSTDRQLEKSAWILLTPKARPLGVEVQGDVKAAPVAQDGDHEVRTFTAEHVPPLVPEIMMAPVGDVLRRVSVSTVPGWDEFVRWERALLIDAFRADDKLKALVQKLTADAKTPAEKRDRLYHFVSHDIRYQQEYEDSIAGVRPHAAPVVLERGYGDCKDKAVLLIQMAKLADIKLEFALLRTTPHGTLNKTLPYQQFNHAIVYVPEQPGLPEQFLDGTAADLDLANLPGGDQGALSLVLDPETGTHTFRPIPYHEPERELIRHRIEVEVTSPEAASATDEVTLRGGLGSYYRRLVRNEEAAQKSYQQLVSGMFPASTLRKGSAENIDDIWKPVVLNLSMDVGGAIQPQDQQWRLILPNSFGLGHVASLLERRTPLRLGPPQQSTVEIGVRLPPGYVAKHLPAAIDVHHRCFDVRRTVRRDGQRLSVVFDFVRRCTDVSPQDYPELREAAQKVQRLAQDQIVFAKAAR